MQAETESAGTVSDENDSTHAEDTSPESNNSTEKEGEQSEGLGTRSQIESLSTCKRRITATVPVEKIKEELDKNYKELASTVNLPGFRRGRVPRQLLEARYGKEIESDVKEALLSLSLSEVVEAHKLDVVGSPKIKDVQFTKDADLGYVVELEVRPDFELAEYKSVEVEGENVSVKAEDIEERLALMQRKAAKLVSVNPSDAGMDDVYLGKYNLYRDGAKVKSGVEASFTPSSNVLHEFFVEGLGDRVKNWNLTSGEPLRIPVKAHGNFSDEVLRHADLELEFVLEDTRRVDLPELNEEFAKTFQTESLEALRAEVRKSMEDRSRREADKKVETKILEKILATATMEIPEGLVESIINRRRMEREYELLEKGVPAEEVKATLVREWEQSEVEGQKPGSSENLPSSAASEEIRREIKEFFVLEKIASNEKIFATEEEVDKRVNLMASLYGIPLARFRDELRSSGRLEEVRFSLRNEKVRAFLRKEARILGSDGQPQAAGS